MSNTVPDPITEGPTYAIRHLHGCESRFVESVPIDERCTQRIGPGPCGVCLRCWRALAAQLAEALVALQPAAEHAMPKRHNKGSRGPNADCDGSCMDAAYIAEALSKARKALAAYDQMPKPKEAPHGT